MFSRYGSYMCVCLCARRRRWSINDDTLQNWNIIWIGASSQQTYHIWPVPPENSKNIFEPNASYTPETNGLSMVDKDDCFWYRTVITRRTRWTGGGGSVPERGTSMYREDSNCTYTVLIVDTTAAITTTTTTVTHLCTAWSAVPTVHSSAITTNGATGPAANWTIQSVMKRKHYTSVLTCAHIGLLNNGDGRKTRIASSGRETVEKKNEKNHRGFPPGRRVQVSIRGRHAWLARTRFVGSRRTNTRCAHGSGTSEWTTSGIVFGLSNGVGAAATAAASSYTRTGG